MGGGGVYGAAILPAIRGISSLQISESAGGLIVVVVLYNKIAASASAFARVHPLRFSVLGFALKLETGFGRLKVPFGMFR